MPIRFEESGRMLMNPLLLQTRRHFFQRCAVGLGSIALASLLNGAAPAQRRRADQSVAPKRPHHPAKAKHVIYLFMAGGPSQLELFDHKPKLQRLHGKPIPDSFIKGKRFAFMDTLRQGDAEAAGHAPQVRPARPSRNVGVGVLPHIAGIVDDIAIVRSMATERFQSRPGEVFVNTGSPQFGRPSMGAWVTYGIGSEAQRPARLRRAAIRSARAARRAAAVGQRVLADHLSGRAVPLGRRADPRISPARRASRRPPARGPRRHQGPELGAPGGHRRSGNRHAHRRLRDGVPHADQRTRS